ncbi:unnamed protein product [Cylicocyclus nassatus]|uniref:DNA mismatch repair protein S5 domain-containing protein n=1 Tax=Cylicocyclus nassatus TaxID=53992 RepID=A0AA36M5L0_CYLNA|nr:unnamed protein product [Cylicocyclus nassatus]
MMGIIQRLPEDVVNRIAAGEVVVRPANAVKELIENSLDAGATEITVTVKEGGLGLLQVQDNGKGIHKDDLDIVCERFTTSKLHKFEDLQSMQTYGFRGEALSSISHVAKVTITSKPADQQCAYQAKYIDGKPESIKASAGLNGTCIAAEDLFYNCPNRRKAFRNYADEANRIADVVMRYAVHRPDISFAMRRGGTGADFRTSGRCSRAEIICSLLGKECGENMIDFGHVSQRLHYSCDVCMTPPVSSVTARSVQAKKKRHKSFFIFINGRLVHCQPLKYAVDTLLSDRDLVCPFALISLKIDPARVDVNVHPTKQTVVFLEEEAIIEDLQEEIKRKLENIFGKEIAPRSLSKKHQLLTPTQISRIPGQTQGPSSLAMLGNDSDCVMEEVQSPSAPKKQADYTLVRVDKKERRLDEFMSTTKSAQPSTSVEVVQVAGSQQEDSVQNETVNGKPRRVFKFESLSNLRRKICDSASQPLRELFKSLTYVGCVSTKAMLLQFGTSLYVIDLERVLRELFYQTLIFSFGNFGSFKLGEEGANIAELLELAGLERESLNGALQLLEEQAAMLNDYFSLQIARPLGTQSGDEGLRELTLLTVPSVIDGYMPQMEGLPALMLALVKNVNWEEEEACFHDVSRALAEFFVMKEEFCQDEALSGLEGGKVSWISLVRDVLIPRVKSHLVPSDTLRDGIKRLADLHDLYKVFERC